MSMVRIVWTDSGTFHEKGWESKTEILESSHGLSDVITVGELVHEEDDKYFVALSSDHVNSHYYGVQIIGKFSVKEFDLLVVPPKDEYIPTLSTRTFEIKDIRFSNDTDQYDPGYFGKQGEDIG